MHETGWEGKRLGGFEKALEYSKMEKLNEERFKFNGEDENAAIQKQAEEAAAERWKSVF